MINYGSVSWQYVGGLGIVGDKRGCFLPCMQEYKNRTTLLLYFAAAGLRTPLAVPGPYPAPFGMVPHAGMNGELTSPGAAYASLHNMSPQMSAAAAAAAVVAYGRSPMVGHTLYAISVA